MVILFTIFKHEPLTYNDYVYPWWGEAIGVAMTLSSVIWIPIYAIYRYIDQKFRTNEPNVEGTSDKKIYGEKKHFGTQLNSRNKLLDSELDVVCVN